MDDLGITKISKHLYSKNASTTGSKGEILKYDPVELAAELLSSDVYVDYWWGDLADGTTRWTFDESGSAKEVAELYFDLVTLVGNIEVSGNEDGSNSQTVPAIDFYRATVLMWDQMPVSERTDDVYDKELHELYRVYVAAYDKCVLKQKSETNIITNLASYFKEAAWTTNEGGWKANKSVIQNALMYAILVVQSLIFFIAYTKRLFYVVMLIIMAPVVVVFDFFTKFGK